MVRVDNEGKKKVACPVLNGLNNGEAFEISRVPVLLSADKAARKVSDARLAVLVLLNKNCADANVRSVTVHFAWQARIEDGKGRRVSNAVLSM